MLFSFLCGNHSLQLCVQLSVWPLGYLLDFDAINIFHLLSCGVAYLVSYGESWRLEKGKKIWCLPWFAETTWDATTAAKDPHI